MKNSWLGYLLIVVISVGAGVAIAGTPSSVSDRSTIVAPATTAAPEPTIPTTAAPADPPTTTLPVETQSTEPAAPSTTTTSASTSTTTTTEPVPERESIAVVAVNGAGVGGIAGRMRDELLVLGYESVRTIDGDVVDETAVYFLEGFEREAQEVALDLGLDPFRNQLVTEGPTIELLFDDQVVVHIGRDRS